MKDLEKPGLIDDWRQMLVDVSNAWFAQMMGMDGPSMIFEVKREKGATEDPQLTFSSDAIEKVRDSMMMWLGTRVMRFYDEQNQGPKKMTITISVVCEQ